MGRGREIEWAGDERLGEEMRERIANRQGMRDYEREVEWG